MAFAQTPMWRIIKVVDDNPGSGAMPMHTVVDLQTKAVGLACRLGNLSSFIPATKELLTCKLLPSHEFKKNSKKIIALTEVARKSLISAGIQVYAFSYCTEPLVPCKRAYINLLNMIQDNRHNVDPAMEARMQSLLVPLSPSFIFHKNGNPSSVVLLEGSQKQGKAPAAACGAFSCTSSFITTAQPSLMPPPDAFPSALYKNRRDSDPFGLHRKPSRPRLWTAEEVRPRSSTKKTGKRRRSKSPTKLRTEVDQENVIPDPQAHSRIFRPLPRRFGIFCTGKSSMHGLNPVERPGRPTIVRSLVKE